MALNASVAALNITDTHDTIETRNKLAVLSNIDDDDDLELRSIGSNRSQQHLQKSPNSNNKTDLLQVPSQQHDQQSLSQHSLSESQHSQHEIPEQHVQTQPTNSHNVAQETGQSTFSVPDKTVSFSDGYPESIPPPKYNTIRQKIFTFLDSPKSSKYAFCVSLLLLSVVILSTLTFLIGSLPEFWTHPPHELFVIESFCVSVFLAEYLLKLFTCPNWKKWIVAPLTMIDLLAIVPFLLEFVIQSNLGSIAVIRVIRLIRIFRIFKLGKFSITMTIVGRTIVKAREGILLLVFLVILSLLIFSSALFYAEQASQTFDEKTKTWIRDDGTESPYQSIPATFWWCAVTLTTTGYGDQFPVSWPGRVVAILTMLCGILVIAFPVTIINTHFQDTWQEVKSAQRQKKEEQKYTKKGVQTLDRTVKLLLKRNYLMLEQMAEMNLQLQRYQYEITQMNNMLEAIQAKIPQGQIGIAITSSDTVTDTVTDTLTLTTKS